MISPSDLFEKIREEELLDPAAGTQVADPEAVRSELGPSVQYSQAVEAEVPHSAAVITSLLPNISDDLAEFFDVWQTQEEVHGSSQLELLGTIGMEPVAAVTKTGRLFDFLGKVISLSPGLHDAMEVGVLSYAALGEKETQGFYAKLSHKLGNLGEEDLQRELFTPMSRQESLHLAYYKAAVGERVQRLQPWQLRIVGKFLEMRYWPVGVQKSNGDRAEGFGRIAVSLTDGDIGEVDRVAAQVQTLADQLVGPDIELKDFVAKRYRACVEEYQASLAAA